MTGEVPTLQHTGRYHRDLIAMAARAQVLAQVFAETKAMRIGGRHTHATAGTFLILLQQQCFATEKIMGQLFNNLKKKRHYSLVAGRVNIICGRGGAQSRVPRMKGILTVSSGLMVQLDGIGNSCCLASFFPNIKHLIYVC